MDAALFAFNVALKQKLTVLTSFRRVQGQVAASRIGFNVIILVLNKVGY